jgi:AraC-like DNA-binding protein
MSPSNHSNQQPAFFSQQVRQARRFYLDLTPDKRKLLTVVCGGHEECLPEYIVDRATFPYLSLEFVSRGKGVLHLNGQETQIAMGTIFTYGPGIPHTIIADSKDPFSKYFVDFVGREAKQLLRASGLTPGSVRNIAAPIDVQRTLDELIHDAAQSSGRSLALCDTLLKYLFQKLALLPSVPKQSVRQQGYSTYHRCREYIEQHYLRLQTLTEIAKETFVDKAYLCRLFQLYDQQTPYQLLTRLKMYKAAELLEDPDKMIKQVANALGYSDPFHFSRTFKGVFGMSPKAFRRLRS